MKRIPIRAFYKVVGRDNLQICNHSEPVEYQVKVLKKLHVELYTYTHLFSKLS